MNYPYLRAWGFIIGMTKTDIESRVRLAIKDNAPQDAIVRMDDDSVAGPCEWATMSGAEDSEDSEIIFMARVLKRMAKHMEESKSTEIPLEARRFASEGREYLLVEAVELKSLSTLLVETQRNFERLLLAINSPFDTCWVKNVNLFTQWVTADLDLVGSSVASLVKRADAKSQKWEEDQ